MTTTSLKLMPKQFQFCENASKVAAYIGGIGAGKSYALAAWIIIQALNFPDCHGIVAANTYSQLTDATLNTIFLILSDLKIKYTYQSQRHHLSINNSNTIFCYSLEKYDNIRGVNVGYIGIDEAAYIDYAAYKVLLGRLRSTKGPRQLKMASSPNGFNYLYDLISNNNCDLISASSRDNIFLPQDYIDSLESQYDEKQRKQEIEGAFINTASGLIYHSFNRNINVIPFSKPSNISLIGANDFNVDPLTAVIGWEDKDCIYIWKELFLRDSNTFKLADELPRYLPIKSTLIPDSTGNSRKTSSTKTDHQILKDAGYIIPHVHNPAVKDRYNCVNGLLFNKKLIIHPDCKYLIKDLEQFSYDNKDPMLSHISDALGYLVWHLKPLKKPITKPMSF